MKVTKREEQVLSLIASGMKSSEVARCMGVSVRTIDAHLSNIFMKFGVTNRSAALMKFVKTRDISELEAIAAITA